MKWREKQQREDQVTFYKIFQKKKKSGIILPQKKKMKKGYDFNSQALLWATKKRYYVSSI